MISPLRIRNALYLHASLDMADKGTVMNLWQRATFRYLCYGVLFGALFPIMATSFAIWLRGLPFTLTSVGLVQATDPLHWMIDTAPLFLGLFAAFAGRRQERLEQVLHLAERAEELARLNAENAQLYEQTRKQLEQLQQLHQDLDGAARTIRTLAAPLIPVRPHVLALPLIGVFDGQRVAEVRADTLGGVAARRARIVIVDCTGVEDMSQEAVLELGRTIDALALLGARTLICGIGAALAQRMAGSDFNRREIVAAPDLAGGIALADLESSWRGS
jgi:anti-anti-sigma regulatory factor